MKYLVEYLAHSRHSVSGGCSVQQQILFLKVKEWEGILERLMITSW